MNLMGKYVQEESKGVRQHAITQQGRKADHGEKQPGKNVNPRCIKLSPANVFLLLFLSFI